MSLGRAAFLRKARFGVFAHALAEHMREKPDPESWNRWCDTFDVSRYAAQVESSGAGYVIFTVGQNSGFFAAPNPVYAELTGCGMRLSKRDLIADLAAEIHRRGMRLIVYLPSGAPCNDPEACRALEWSNANYVYSNPWAGAGRQVDFQLRWEQILCCWAESWGTCIDGWFVDGMYHYKTMYDFPEAPCFRSLAAALRAGNPDAALAFNSGTALMIKSISEEEDYTAGECAEAFPVGGYYVPGKFTGIPGTVQGKVLHVCSFLGELWGCGSSPRFPPELAAAYSLLITRSGGAITWDVPLMPDGLIPDAFLRQLEYIGCSVYGILN